MDAHLVTTRSTYFLTSATHEEDFVRTHISELRELLIEHNKRYYQTSDPLISDSEYDQLFALLVEREDRFSDIITSDSPTQRLVGQLLDGFSSARHLAEMGSLQNTYSAGDIAKRDEGLRRIQQKKDIPHWTYIVEPKLDGMSVELVYEYGQFVRAVTRGDGELGEDITEHARYLTGLPMKVNHLEQIPTIAFRGEIVISKDAFARLEGVMTTSGGIFANARNAAAGTLRQLDPSLVKKRGLTVFVYDILFVEEEVACTTAEEQFALFRTWGLPILERIHTFSSIQQVMDRCSLGTTKEEAERKSVDLDGLVIKIQEFSSRALFGQTNHHPKWAIAYKFPAQQIATRLEEVHFQVGRTGILTPVANLTPIQLSGVLISRASLHNRAFIQDRGLLLGDRVLLQRSGEVIPYIVAGLPERRDGTEKPIPLPKTCPVCAHAVHLDDRALAVRCGNSLCDAQLKQRLEHAVSKGALDISGLGPSLIQSVVDAGLVTSVADLFVLCSEDKKQVLRGLPGIGEKKIALLEGEIKEKAPFPLWRVINALGIRHIGEVSSRDIATNYFVHSEEQQRNIQDFITYCIQEETVGMIRGFGTEMIASLQLFFQDKENSAVLERIDAYQGIQWANLIEEQLSSELSGMHIVITGSFSLSRDEIARMLRARGALVQSSVNQRTDLLLVGEGGGSKRQAAEKFGISILTIQEFSKKFLLPEFLTESTTIKTENSPLVQQSSLF